MSRHTHIIPHLVTCVPQVRWSNGEKEPFSYSELVDSLIEEVDDSLDVFNEDHWYPLDMGHEVMVEEDPLEYPDGERPSVLYGYYSDPSIVCFSFGDNEYEGLDKSYHIDSNMVITDGDGEVVRYRLVDPETDHHDCNGDDDVVEVLEVENITGTNDLYHVVDNEMNEMLEGENVNHAGDVDDDGMVCSYVEDVCKYVNE